MTTEFSADAVVSIPQQPIKETKLFVSKKAVRSESIVNGQNIVEIVYPDEGRAVLINQPVKAYQERTFTVQNNKETSSNPCAQILHSECKKLGTETIDGLKTEKWQIISNNQGKRLRTLHWIDVKRKLALREFFPDGTVAELKMVKKEKLNGRDTEKWERSLSRPDGTTTSSFQWYDIGLGIAIKEELPGGYIRELKNIKIASQPGKLFNIPDDFNRIDNQQGAIQPNYINR
ncbi:MAG: hypothetical protein OEY61_13660 [Gammaproteobacteria bacterium]|nr:hypothetical protein [Gammaproteobacteria bacterium]